MNRTTQGLTLIEMLVVIGIVGMITVAMISNVTKGRAIANSNAAAMHGSMVQMTTSSFMSMRPGVTASQILAALPASTSTAAGVPAGGRNCTSGYALSGAAGSVTATATPTAPANTAAWSDAPKNSHCVVTAGGVNAFALNVYSWHDGSTDTVYLNGKKQ